MYVYDVAVVGAGPAGSMVAKHTAKLGLSTILLEEHKAIGFPPQCAGLLSTQALESCEVSHRCVLNEIEGAYIHSPSGKHSLRLGGDKKRAYVVDRRMLDLEMAQHAVLEGAELECGVHVEHIVREKDGVRETGGTLRVSGSGGRRIIHAKTVVIAEGGGARLSRMLGVGAPAKVLSGVQVEVPFNPLSERFVEVFTGKWAPGFFGWAIPYKVSSDDESWVARVGLAVDPSHISQLSQGAPSMSRNAHDYLLRFLEHPSLKGRVGSSILQLTVGGIPLGPPPTTSANGVLVVGDAAAQVKPLTGGGCTGQQYVPE
ncbi:MAG: geranylgeranyl reductase family protein [Methermicoccaceae archaeon]